MLKTFIETYIPDFNSIPSAVLEKKFLENRPIRIFKVTGWPCFLTWQLLLKWTDSLLYNSRPYLVEMFSMMSYTRVDTFVQIRQKTWPPCDFENSDWSIFKKLLLKNRWRDWILLKTFIETYKPDFNSIPSAVLEKKFLENRPIRIFKVTWWPCFLTNLHKSIDSCVGPHRKHLCQVWFWIIWKTVSPF
jgi:uncharacterized protein YlaI